MTLEGVSLLVCTPVRGGFSPSNGESVRTLEAWARDNHIPFDTRRVAEAPVDAARDLLAAAFLTAKHSEPPAPFTHCLMVDAGVGFQPETVEKLLAADEDFTAAAVPLRNVRLDRVAERGETRFGADFAVMLTRDQIERGKAHIEPKAGSPFVEVDGIGAAMICMRRKVFGRIFEGYPELRHKEGFSYFLPAIMNSKGQTPERAARMAVLTAERMHNYNEWSNFDNFEDFERCGEDIAFCRRWRGLHSPEEPACIWVLVDAQLVHEGHGMFHGNFADCFG